mgnify:FL=1
MQKRKMCIKRMVSLWLLLITALVLSSCGNREEDSFGKVMSVKEICSCIQNMQKEIEGELLKANYTKTDTDSNNIDLSNNDIKDRTKSSWYMDEYINEKGTVMEVTYNVEDSSLWLDIEVKGDEKSQPESEYDRAISFYKQFTNANITEEKINTLLEKNKEKSGEYRIDSHAYPDAFQYKITENNETSFFLAGIVK